MDQGKGTTSLVGLEHANQKHFHYHAVWGAPAQGRFRASFFSTCTDSSAARLGLTLTRWVGLALQKCESTEFNS